MVSHLTGLCADIMTGNVVGAPSDAWTAAQVAARRDRTFDEVLAEWNDTAPAATERATIPAAFERHPEYLRLGPHLDDRARRHL